MRRARLRRSPDDLRKDGADPDLIAALEAGSEAVRGDHREMMKRVYFRAPDGSVR